MMCNAIERVSCDEIEGTGAKGHCVEVCTPGF